VNPASRAPSAPNRTLPSMRRLPIPTALLAATLLALLAAGGAAHAQPAAAPAIVAAEQSFERGLRSFRAGQYDAAYSAFIRAATDYDFNQRTTAAYLMAGKALYAAGDFEGAASAMTTLIGSYPRSRYVEEARRVQRNAIDHIRSEPPAAEVTTIGVILPMSSRDAVFSQAVFNGIRLAIDDHNSANPERPIRMVFRSSQTATLAAADAVDELVRSGAVAILGPLYSEEAIAAAGAAERHRTVLVAPMATDARVSEGRRFAFQANATFDVRGRTMARYAAANGVSSIGIVAVRGSLAETMAEAFRAEFERRGGTVAFDERLPADEAWFQLPERIGAARLALADGVYFPVSGARADEQAAAALRGLDLLVGEEGRIPRVFGNSEWQNLDASRNRAAAYNAVFTNDFYPAAGGAAVQTFEARYRALSGVNPDRLALAGFDVTNKLLMAIERAGSGGNLADVLRRAPAYEGLGHRIDFGGEQVNQELFMLRFRNRQLDRAR
jgi:branched-chain amino acid transport system substrate-binding protein